MEKLATESPCRGVRGYRDVFPTDREAVKLEVKPRPGGKAKPLLFNSVALHRVLDEEPALNVPQHLRPVVCSVEPAG